MSESRKARPDANAELLARVRAAARQEQFLEVVSADEARMRFERYLDLSPLAAETVPLALVTRRIVASRRLMAQRKPVGEKFLLHSTSRGRAYRVYFRTI